MTGRAAGLLAALLLAVTAWPAVAAGPPPGSPAAVNGKVKVCGKRLCNAAGERIQLRGMSSHGLQWYPQCLTGNALSALANDWRADVVRLSMYVQEGGYASDPERFTRLAHRLIERASARGLYVIVDWHTLEPGDPNVNLAAAKTFLRKIATRHADRTNILYEVANEPHGVSWASLRDYHQKIIPVIRKRDPDAVILLGTRGWSSFGVSEGADEQEVVDNPVNAKNVMYTFHFYAASHGSAYRNALSRAAGKLPVFVTEFGMQQYTGDGENDFAQTRRYLDMMAKKKVGWVNWNFSDDHRSGAAFEPGTCPDGPFGGTSRLKPSGKWIRARLREG